MLRGAEAGKRGTMKKPEPEKEPKMLELVIDPKYTLADCAAWIARQKEKAAAECQHRMRLWTEWKPSPTGGRERMRRCDRCDVYTEIQQEKGSGA